VKLFPRHSRRKEAVPEPEDITVDLEEVADVEGDEETPSIVGSPLRKHREGGRLRCVTATTSY